MCTISRCVRCVPSMQGQPKLCVNVSKCLFCFASFYSWKLLSKQEPSESAVAHLRCNCKSSQQLHINLRCNAERAPPITGLGGFPTGKPLQHKHYTISNTHDTVSCFYTMPVSKGILKIRFNQDHGEILF